MMKICAIARFFTFSYPVTSNLLSLVIVVQRYVSTKFQVSMAFLFQEHQRYGTDI